jgi:murein DD-endopeptidase MepM/ murein hydrolase activator NlpD
VVGAAFYAALAGGSRASLSANTPPTTSAPPVPSVAEPLTATGAPVDILRTTFFTGAETGPVAASSAPAPDPTSTPLPSRRERCEPSASATLYCIYTVQSGDTLSDIAIDFGVRGTAGVPAAEVLAQSNKPDVIRSDEILPGQKLRIPAANGIIHTVFAAETLDQVATGYGVTAESIRALSLNSIADPSLLTVGQEIIVPDPQKLPAAAAPEPEPAPEPTATPEPEPTATPEPDTPTPQATAQAVATARPTRTPTPSSRRAATATPTPRASAASRAGFIWPATGPISSYFGPRHPLGIDIDFYADPNQAVRAAAAGTVAFAGGDACCSYGYHVIIDHGNGFSTLYAHFSAIAVRTGQRVRQGEVLGAGGRTGYATGNHLHFEIRRDGVVVNPMNYLP